MNMYIGNGGVAPLTLNLSTRWCRWVVNVTLQPH